MQAKAKSASSDLLGKSSSGSRCHPYHCADSASIQLYGGSLIPYLLDEAKGWALSIKELRRAVRGSKGHLSGSLTCLSLSWLHCLRQQQSQQPHHGPVRAAP